MFSSGETAQSGMAGSALPQPSVRHSRTLMKACVFVVAAAFGAMVPSLLPVDLSRHYRVETQLELPGAGRAAQHAFLADAQLKLKTQAFLDQALRRMETSLPALSVGPQQQTALGFLSDLMTRRDVRPSATETLERSRLAEQVVLLATENDRRVSIAVRDASAERAVAIGNAVAELLVSGAANGDPVRDADAVRAARQALEQVQAELETTNVPDTEIEALKAHETAQSELAAERSALETSRAELEDRAVLLAKLQPRELIEDAVPEALAGSGLEEARRRYQDAKLEVDQLSVSLGPRHPRLVAAKATEDEARAAIATSLQRAVASLKQQQANVTAQLQNLAKRQAALDAQPVSDAARKRLALEDRLEVVRRTYLDSLRAAEQTPEVRPTVVRLDRATVEAAEASGLPAWLYAVMGAVAATCLAGAAMPGRAAEDDEPEYMADAVEPGKRGEEPHFSSPVVDDAPAVTDAIRIATPAELGFNDLHQVQPPLDVPDRPLLRDQPLPMLNFDDYLRSTPANDPAPVTRHTLATRAANDPGTSPGHQDGLADEALNATLLTNRMIPTDEQPLPVLLASILSRRDLEARHEKPVLQTPEERDMLELKRQIEVLRREVEEQLAERVAPVQPRYATGR